MALNSNFRTLTADNIEGIVDEKNYLRSSFENGTLSGWREMAVTVDASGFPNATPTIGTDASPNAASSLSLSATSTTPLSGARSLLVTVPTSLSQGQGFISEEFTLDRMDLGKVLTVSFDYERVSGTYNFSGTRGSQTWMVYVYDATAGGANWIQPAGFLGMNQSSNPGRVACTFQSSVTAGQKYRIAVIAHQAASGASSIEFDNFTCSRQTAPIGPVVTDFQGYQPTISGFNAGTTPSGFYRWRRVGDSIHIIGNLTAGGTGIGASGDFVFSLPSGLSYDTSKMTVIAETAIGAGHVHNTGFGRFPCVVIPNTSTAFSLVVRSDAATGGNIVSTNFPSAGWWNAAGDAVAFELMAPITGWSSNIQLSNDTDTRVVAFVGSINSQAYTSLVTNLAMTVSKDSHGTFSSGIYTIPVSGDYSVNATVISDQANFFPTVYLNGSIYTYGTRQASASQATTAAMLIPNLKAGDTISLRIGNTNGNTIAGGYFSVNRLSGPSVVAASDSISLRATSATTAVGTSATTVIFSSKEYDTHNIYSTSTGAITIPVSGKYSIKAITESPGGASAATANAGTYLMLFKGTPGSGSINTLMSNLRWPIATGTGMPVILQGGTTVQANAGDVFYIVQQRDASISAYSLSGTSTTNILVVERVGN